MTLILTVANTLGVCQSSDYRLTDLRTGQPKSDRAGSKQLLAQFKDFDLDLAFTGIANVGSQSTVNWILNELKTIPQESELQDVCDALASRSIAITRSHGTRGMLEFVLIASAVGKPFRVAVVSNVDWSKHNPQAGPIFSKRIYTIAGPFYLISGYRKSVQMPEEFKLRSLARNIGRTSPKEILEALARINKISAKHSGGLVSEGCWVNSQISEGRVRRRAARNFGDHSGTIHQVLGGLDMSQWIKENFQVPLGKEIQIVQSAGVRLGPEDWTPLPPPTGDPLRFTLTVSASSGKLRDPKGNDCAVINVLPIGCVVEMRRNEEVTVQLATVELSGIRPLLGTSLPKPKFPWPQLRPELLINGIAVRNCELSVGCQSIAPWAHTCCS